MKNNPRLIIWFGSMYVYDPETERLHTLQEHLIQMEFPMRRKGFCQK